MQADFDDFLPIASNEAKASKSADVQVIFKAYSLGVSTNRDNIVYDHNFNELKLRIESFIDDYNFEVKRWIASDKKVGVDSFVSYDKLKWSRNLKNELKRENYTKYEDAAVRRSIYRPYTSMWLYSGDVLVDEHGTSVKYFPVTKSQPENSAIVIGGYGRKEFSILAVNLIPNLNFYADPAQCFPLYTYAVGGKIRRDNITDWALGQFQAKYGPTVTKRDIFHYVYALLHHPEYRERYKENLKRELPRLPLVADADGTVFQTYVTVGAELAALHVGYEDAAEYPLKQVVTKDVPLSWRVTKMRLSADKTAVKINDSLTLTGLPPEVFAYKLGNRSALEWVLDQFQVTTDKRSGLVSDPNRADAPDYIARLVRRVVTVSVETQARVGRLPGL